MTPMDTKALIERLEDIAHCYPLDDNELRTMDEATRALSQPAAPDSLDERLVYILKGDWGIVLENAATYLRCYNPPEPVPDYGTKITVGRMYKESAAPDHAGLVAALEPFADAMDRAEAEALSVFDRIADDDTHLNVENDENAQTFFVCTVGDLRRAREAIAALSGVGPVAVHSDDLAVDRFAAAMKAKLAKKREDGRGGWEQCEAGYLSELLRDHVEKGDPLDVGNLAMMLHQRGERITK